MGDNKYVGDDSKVDEASIYQDAWRIAYPGAANPVAVAGTLARASAALLHVSGTDAVRKHPALRVMAGQLAMLYNVNAIGPELEDLDKVEAEAKKYDRIAKSRALVGGILDDDQYWKPEDTARIIIETTDDPDHFTFASPGTFGSDYGCVKFYIDGGPDVWFHDNETMATCPVCGWKAS